MSVRQSAILILGFGGPENSQDVRPFIERVVKGRNVPAERIDLVVEQYKQIGGRSPYLELTRRQQKALADAFKETGHELPTYLGMLFCQPTIAEALTEMSVAGVQQAIVIIMAPHRTEASFQRYVQALEAAGASCSTPPIFEFLPAWHLEPLFVEAAADCVADQLQQLALPMRAQTQVIFTAHSVPQEMSVQSGYAAQIEATAAAVFERLQQQIPGQFDWTVGYQSRSGAPAQRWLEPDVATQLTLARQAGKSTAIIMPIGFLVDHVEVLYDLDILAAQAARAAGITMLRAATVCDHPQFIKLLSQLALAKLESSYARS